MNKRFWLRRMIVKENVPNGTLLLEDGLVVDMSVHKKRIAEISRIDDVADSFESGGNEKCELWSRPMKALGVGQKR